MAEAKIFFKDGFHHISNVFDKDQVKALRKLIAPHFANMVTGGLFIDFALKNEIILKSILHDKIISFLKKLSSTVIYHPDLHIMVNNIDQRGAKKGWHIDSGWENSHFKKYLFSKDYRHYKVGIFLQDDSLEYGGSIEVQKGGHDSFRPRNSIYVSTLCQRILSKFNDFSKPRVRIPAKAGDVLIFDSRLPHASASAKIPHNEIPLDKKKMILYWDVSGNQLDAKSFYFSELERTYMGDHTCFLYDQTLALDKSDFSEEILKVFDEKGIELMLSPDGISHYFKSQLEKWQKYCVGEFHVIPE